MSLLNRLTRGARKNVASLLFAAAVPLVALAVWPQQAGADSAIGGANLARYFSPVGIGGIRIGGANIPRSGAAARQFKRQRRLSDELGKNTATNPGT